MKNTSQPSITSGAERRMPMLCDEYHAYLLRLWRVQTNGHNWHALLQDVASGERYGFATMEMLVTFLNMLSEEPDSPDQKKGHGIGEEANDQYDASVKLV
jgi:hypothetical protein